MGKLLGIVLGTALGFLLGGPWIFALPIAGFLVALLAEKIGAPQSVHDGDGQGSINARVGFARSMAALFVLVAEIDGEMTRAEAASIRDFFADTLGFNAHELEQVRVALKEARATTPDLEVVLYAAREHLGTSERSLLLYALAQVAAADRPVSREEWTLLARIAHGLNLDPDVAASMLGGHTQRPANPERPPRRERSPDPDPVDEPEPEPEPDPESILANSYAKLGMGPEATEAQLKQAYRGLAQKLHPDKVQHLGPRAVELAGRAFSDVSEAYETVRRERGF